MEFLGFFLVLIVLTGFTGIAFADDEMFMKDTKIELWPENKVSFGNWTQIMWTICPISQDTQRQPFADPQIKRDVKYGQTLSELHITKPSGKELVESLATDVADCQDEKQWTVHFNLPGTWKFFVTNKWYDGAKFYLAKSLELVLDVSQPRYFTTQIKYIDLEMDAFGYHVLDWGSKGDILFSYESKEPPEKIHLAVMDQYGDDIQTINSTSYSYLYAKFFPDNNLIYWIDDAKLYEYNIQTDKQRKIIDAYNFDFLKKDNGYDIVFLNMDEELMVFDGKTSKPLDGFRNSGVEGFDVSPDGSKLLFKKTIDAGYGWADRVLAYTTRNGSEEKVLGVSLDCGADPKFSPSGELVVYHTQSCGRSAPGGTIHITNLDGTVNEILVPYRNTNPYGYAFSPDGTKIIYNGDGSDFEVMTLGNSVGASVSNIVAIQSPLKQFSSGISFDKIQCKNNLVLTQKRDGSPACVYAKTKLKLIERGWAIQNFTYSESLKNEILSQLRKGQQNVNGTARDFVVSEILQDKSLSGILEDSEYQVNCCSYLLDGNSLQRPLSLGITFQVDEKRMIVTAEYDLQQEKISSIATFPIKTGGFVSFSEESENNGVYTTMKPNTMEFFYYPDPSPYKQEPYRLFMLIRLPEWMGGGANDTSAFRAFSAKSLDDPCIVKYWPQEGRQRIENPCQGGMYRVIDGTMTLGLTHRSTAMTALPHLDLSIDEEGGLYVDTPSWTKTENGVIGYGRDMSLDEIRSNSEFLLDSFENSYPEYPKIPLSFAGYLLSEIYPEKNSVTVWYLDFPNKSGHLSMSIDKLSRTDYANLATPHSEFWKIGDTMIKISGSALDKSNELPEQYKTYTIEFNDGFDFHIEGKNLEFIKKEIIANYFPDYEYDDLLFISRNN